jgi:predicted transcriptional regulator
MAFLVGIVTWCFELLRNSLKLRFSFAIIGFELKISVSGEVPEAYRNVIYKVKRKCQVKIPKSKVELKRPVDKHHAILRIEKENVWIRSLNRQLAETFCSLVTRSDPVTALRTSGVLVWGTYAGEPDKTGTIILDHKPDGRFKLVPLNNTPNSLLTEVAKFVGRHGSVTSKEGKRGLIFRGEFRSPGEPIEMQEAAQESESRDASAREKTLANKVKIPKSEAELKRPVDKRHAILRIENENAWVRSLNRQLGETFCTLITRGDPVTVVRTAGVLVWGTYAGEPENTGTIILDHKPDGRFKLVPLSITPNSLLTEVAYFVGRHGSVTSEEGKHGLIFRGELRNPGESIEAKSEVTPAAEAPTGKFEKITGADAIAAIRQKVTMEFIEGGVKVRIQGKKTDCEKTAKRILKGSPTVASQRGSKYMIEGNLNKSFLRKGTNQQGPDANGVYTRENISERTLTAIGENLTAVQAACLTGCKEDMMFTIVVNDRSTGHFVISSGRRSLV